MCQDAVGIYTVSGISNPFSTICRAIVRLSVTADFCETPSIVGIPIMFISIVGMCTMEGTCRDHAQVMWVG
jgi:hypothetical protein